MASPHDTVDDSRRFVGQPTDTEADELWHRLYSENVDSVYRLILCLGVPERDVEDLTQDVFYVLHRNLQRNVVIRSPGGWLRRVALRSVTGYRRFAAVRRARAWLVRNTFAAQASVPETPEQIHEGDEIRWLVRGVLGQLSTKLRDTVVLCDIEGCTPQEAAEILGIPVNTVRSRRRLGQDRFRQLWHERYADRGDHGPAT